MKYIVFLALVSLVGGYHPHVFAKHTKRTNPQIPVGDSPAGSAITPDGRFAYVANNNNDGIPNGDSVSVIDLRTNTLLTTIQDPSFAQPYTITLNSSGTRAYVSNSNGTTVSIIDTATNSVISVIDGFDGPSGFALSPDGTTAYVNNYGGPFGVGSGNGTTISIVDVASQTIVGAPIVVCLAPAALALSASGDFLYVISYVDGNPGTGTFTIIRTSDNAIIKTITGFSGPFALALTPNGRYAYVTNFGSNNFSPVGTTVSVVDLQLQATITNVSVGTQPSGIAISPDGRYSYVTIYNTLYLGPNFTDLTPGVGLVKIIDTCTNRVVRPSLCVGPSPANIALTPSGCCAYVSNYSGNSVSVVRVGESMWLDSCN